MTATAEILELSLAAGGQHMHRRINITIEPDAVRAIGDAICTGAIPDLYVRSGSVARVLVLDDGVTPRLVIRPVDADSLRQLLAMYAECYRVRMVNTKEGGSETKETPALPAVSVAKAVLSAAEWPGLPVLAGVTSFPLIRKSGTVRWEEGYDEQTRLYYRPAFKLPPIPDVPPPEVVQWARDFILKQVIHDVCFDSDASRANYLALLVTPLLRLYLGSLPPLGIISATIRSSGKTLLTDILRAVYGAKLKPWPKRDEEMSKVITSTLKDDTEPVIVFDNVGPFDTVDHANLAALLTTDEWSDRILGASSNYSGVNDRLWFVTGNNVAIGGDIASRSILVRLDPHMSNPEERDDFIIKDVWSWLKDDTNRSNLLAALLILVRAWIEAGAPKDAKLRMRNFSTWAQGMGGFLAYHQVPGFLMNKQELAVTDDEETSTASFLAKWYERYGEAKQRATSLVESARPQVIGTDWYDPWDGAFPARPDGKPFTSKGLARYLGARRGRIFAEHTLIGEYDDHTKVWFYAVHKTESATQMAAA